MRKHKNASISLTVRDRAISSKFSTPRVFKKYIRQLFKNFSKMAAIWRRYALSEFQFDIICGCNQGNAFDFFISLVSFYIYKEWITLYKHNEDWTRNDIIYFVKNNIKLYIDTHKHCKSISGDICIITEQFLS